MCTGLRPSGPKAGMSPTQQRSANESQKRWAAMRLQGRHCAITPACSPERRPPRRTAANRPTGERARLAGAIQLLKHAIRDLTGTRPLGLRACKAPRYTRAPAARARHALRAGCPPTALYLHSSGAAAPAEEQPPEHVSLGGVLRARRGGKAGGAGVRRHAGAAVLQLRRRPQAVKHVHDLQGKSRGGGDGR